MKKWKLCWQHLHGCLNRLSLPLQWTKRTNLLRKPGNNLTKSKLNSVLFKTHRASPSVVTHTVAIRPEDKLRNAIFWLWRDAPRVTRPASLFFILTFPKGPIPVARFGTIWSIRLHSWPQEYWLFSVHTRISYLLSFAFFWVWLILCWHQRVQLVVSCA